MGQQTSRMVRRARVLAALAVAAMLAACGGGGGSDGPDAQPAVTCVVPAVPLIRLFGDSTMFSGNGNASFIQYELDKALGEGTTHVINNGVGATSLHQLMAGTDGRNAAWPAPAADADLVVINHGLNDVRLGHTPAEVIALYKQVLARPNVMLQTPVQPREKPADEIVPRLARMQRDLMDGDVIDVQAFTAKATEADIPDGIHPTEAYYWQIVRAVTVPAILQRLQAMKECRS